MSAYLPLLLALLESVAHKSSSDNRFMPTKAQNDKLREINEESAARDDDEPAMHTRSWQEWSRFVRVHLRKVLYFQHENGGRQREADMKERARVVVTLVEENDNIDTICFMDGHGRFLFALLEALMKLPLTRRNTLKLKVVDIDEQVHAWHTLFFPADVQCELADIYAMSPSSRGANNLIYFNFCGIGGKSGIDTLARFVCSEKFAGEQFLLSLSTRGNWTIKPKVLLQAKLGQTFLGTQMTAGEKFITIQYRRAVQARTVTTTTTPPHRPQTNRVPANKAAEPALTPAPCAPTIVAPQAVPAAISGVPAKVAGPDGPLVAFLSTGRERCQGITDKGAQCLFRAHARNLKAGHSACMKHNH